MSYDYKENGWQQHESGLWFKQMDGVWFYTCPNSRVLYGVGGGLFFPKWAQSSVDAYNPAALDAAWSAELKRRESLPLLDPDKWEGGDDRGYWYHPAEGGYRLHQCEDGDYLAYKTPIEYICCNRNLQKVKNACENDARSRKGLPPL